jgi:hypothetical protein
MYTDPPVLTTAWRKAVIEGSVQLQKTSALT